MAVLHPGKPTATAQDYLVLIYHMTNWGRPVIGARLAEKLRVSPPTVAGMLRRLTRDGLVAVNRRKEISLTGKGWEIAETTVRRHLLSERFLALLGLEWHKVHEEAHRFEHAISPEVEELLWAFLGQPTTCPHGNPIPRSGAAPPKATLTLDQARPGEELVIERISEHAEMEEGMLGYMAQNGLMPGATLRVMEIAPFRGPIALEVGPRTAAISPEVASYVWVYPK